MKKLLVDIYMNGRFDSLKKWWVFDIVLGVSNV